MATWSPTFRARAFLTCWRGYERLKSRSRVNLAW